VTFDTGALLALERGDGRLTALLSRIADDPEGMISIPAGVLAQVWRDGARQVRLNRLVTASSTEIVPLDEASAQAAGALLARRGGSDVIDASVVLCAAERDQGIVSSDPDDLQRLAPRVVVHRI
jgi:hypothetical protein